ncbi:NUDIX hydrolase [Micromonospora sp. NPDC050417]|uniref:NUDIX hydrolase n=1 Tax=Micromonospora sp. NPDC050417 TaxID=3364280 RepID=UPI0037AD8429
MRPSVAVVHDLVGGVRPVDQLEADHQAEVLRWLWETDDVFRRVKPALPPRHLVSYVVPIDPTDGAILLVDHVNAGLWLPPGGHVEPDEHPAGTALREAREELGINTERFSAPDGSVGAEGFDGRPAFLTVTRTVGIDHGHTDVSLWFPLPLRRTEPLTGDPGEFREARWWSPAEIAGTDPGRFDPHFGRFTGKIGTGSDRFSTRPIPLSTTTGAYPQAISTADPGYPQALFTT